MQSIFIPYHTPSYKLIYGTQFFYIFYRQIYTIYERLLKAKELIDAKVESDLKERAEEGLKDKINEFKRERFEVMVGGLLSTLNNSMDSNKYEDFVRVLCGGKAYLLFSFDKLITTVSSSLIFEMIYVCV
jgi:histone deacetylase complex regulatory component SIN3